MVFDIRNLFGRGASNLLLQPQPTDPGNMLLQPLQTRPEPQNYPVAAPQPDPQTVAAVANASPEMMPQMQVADAGGKANGLGGFNLFGDNPDRKAFLQDMFLGWAAGQTPTQSLALGAAQAAKGRGDRRNTNDTVDWLKGRGLDEGSAKQLASSPSALSAYLNEIFGSQKKQSLIPTRGGSIYDPNTGEWISAPNGEASAATEYGLSPIYGTDAQGGTVIGQLAKDGTFQQTKLPAGFQPTPGISNTDLGTSVITRNSRTGDIIDTQAKDVSGQALQQQGGKNIAEAQAALPGIESASNRALSTLQSLADDPYLPRMLGSLDSRLPNFSSDAARVQGKMDQLQGQAFLEAYNSLRGAGAITDTEGPKAEAAIARLKTAQNEQDYLAALNDFKGVIQEGLANARRKASGSYMGAPTQSPQAPAGAVRVFNPATGMIE